MNIYVINQSMEEYRRISDEISKQCLITRIRSLSDPKCIAECDDFDDVRMVIVSEGMYDIRKADIVHLRDRLPEKVKMLVESDGGYMCI